MKKTRAQTPNDVKRMIDKQSQAVLATVNGQIESNNKLRSMLQIAEVVEAEVDKLLALGTSGITALAISTESDPLDPLRRANLAFKTRMTTLNPKAPAGKFDPPKGPPLPSVDAPPVLPGPPTPPRK